MQLQDRVQYFADVHVLGDYAAITSVVLELLQLFHLEYRIVSLLQR
jgi:hypothetical protein